MKVKPGTDRGITFSGLFSVSVGVGLDVGVGVGLGVGVEVGLDVDVGEGAGVQLATSNRVNTIMGAIHLMTPPF